MKRALNRDVSFFKVNDERKDRHMGSAQWLSLGDENKGDLGLAGLSLQFAQLMFLQSCSP